ncbi:MlaC/ttg2D family ABC transporter substrate-binding protein [Marinicellulosiphila megalodicopiae]|uniref:MlaC/ttg2D family ABC transporter substrate-binding protein n=1 Tax=Marinicellulosiphila megalodicopiae TaxID=2724896 RepID=UPI003BB0DF7E
MKKIIIALSTLLALVSFSWAETEIVPAEKAVEDGVNMVLSTIESNIGASGGIENQQEFIDIMIEQLKPVIGFQQIATKVMGSFYKDATREQKIRFITAFTHSMVQTYAAGMVNFVGYDVKIVSSRDNQKNTYKNTRIYLDVISPDGPKYPMVQSLYYSKRNEAWLIQNIEFNGINLGIMFANQFNQVMSDNDNDLDAAIDAWVKTTQDSYEQTSFRDK